MRILSPTAREAINAPETDEVFLVLLTIEEDSLPEPIRVVHNHEDIVSNGETYLAFFFGLELPEERGETMSGSRIVIDNVDRQIVDAVRRAVGRPQLTLEVVLASDPHTVEAGPFVFVLDNVEYDATTVTGEAVFEEIINRRCPAHTTTPWTNPDAF